MWFQRVMADHGPCPYKPLKDCKSQVKKRMGLLFLRFPLFCWWRSLCPVPPLLLDMLGTCLSLPALPLCKMGRVTITFLRPTHETSSIGTEFYNSNSDIIITWFNEGQKDLLCILFSLPKVFVFYVTIKALGPNRGQNCMVEAGRCYRGGLRSNQKLIPAFKKFLSATLTTRSPSFPACPDFNTHHS